MDALRSENESLKEQAELNFELACAEEDRAKTAEAQLFSARARIAALESKASASGLSDDAIDNLPNTWSDVPAWCDEYLAGKLSLTPVARRGMRAPEYDDVERACRGLHWIAADFRQRRIDGGGSIANIPIGHDLENAPCGSDEFQFTHQGKTLVADWHIKSGGNTRDPARCLRIYFTFDPITQEAVVADMPAHRRTSAT
jgi:hypothetical protein